MPLKSRRHLLRRAGMSFDHGFGKRRDLRTLGEWEGVIYVTSWGERIRYSKLILNLDRRKVTDSV